MSENNNEDVDFDVFLIQTPTSWSFWTRREIFDMMVNRSGESIHIVSDDLSHIIVKNNCLHIQEQNGHFLKYVDGCGLKWTECGQRGEVLERV